MADKLAELKMLTLAADMTLPLICTLVARLTEVEVKTIGHTETTIEMGALVETLSDPLMKMKSRRRSTLRITE